MARLGGGERAVHLFGQRLDPVDEVVGGPQPHQVVQGPHLLGPQVQLPAHVGRVGQELGRPETIALGHRQSGLGPEDERLLQPHGAGLDPPSLFGQGPSRSGCALLGQGPRRPVEAQLFVGPVAGLAEAGRGLPVPPLGVVQVALGHRHPPEDESEPRLREDDAGPHGLPVALLGEDAGVAQAAEVDRHEAHGHDEHPQVHHVGGGVGLVEGEHGLLQRAHRLLTAPQQLQGRRRDQGDGGDPPGCADLPDVLDGGEGLPGPAHQQVVRRSRDDQAVPPLGVLDVIDGRGQQGLRPRVVIEAPEPGLGPLDGHRRPVLVARPGGVDAGEGPVRFLLAAHPGQGRGQGEAGLDPAPGGQGHPGQALAQGQVVGAEGPAGRLGHELGADLAAGLEAGHGHPQGVVPAADAPLFDDVGHLAVALSQSTGRQRVPHDLGVDGVTNGDHPPLAIAAHRDQALDLEGLHGVLADGLGQGEVADDPGHGDQFETVAGVVVQQGQALLDDLRQPRRGRRLVEVPQAGVLAEAAPGQRALDELAEVEHVALAQPGEGGDGPRGGGASEHELEDGLDVFGAQGAEVDALGGTGAPQGPDGIRQLQVGADGQQDGGATTGADLVEDRGRRVIEVVGVVDADQQGPLVPETGEGGGGGPQRGLGVLGHVADDR